jgi:hypothetical protein
MNPVPGSLLADDAEVAALDRNALRVVVCPLCHTPEPTVTQATLESGAGWVCRRCSQSWDAPRLATVAAYAVWALEHDHPGGTPSTAGAEVTPAPSEPDGKPR